MPHTGRVTSSSAAEGWMAMHESRSALVQPIFMATANPWITSSDAIPNMGWVTGENQMQSVRTICSRYERTKHPDKCYVKNMRVNTYKVDSYNFFVGAVADYLVLRDGLIARTAL